MTLTRRVEVIKFVLKAAPRFCERMVLAAAVRTGTETALGVGLGPVRVRERMVESGVRSLKKLYFN